MPEGDNLHRIAALVRADLVDDASPRALDAVWLSGLPRRDLVGRVVVAVEARGKHLLVTLAGDVVLHVHLGMNGRWRRVRTDELTPQVPPRASVLLVAGAVAHVCADAPVVELLRGRALALHPIVGALGPDLLGEEVDFAAILARARDAANAARPVAELLLDQRVAAGIGNVYKSEVCHVERVHPFLPASALDDAQLEALYCTARRQLLANVDGGWRRTTTADRSRGQLPRPGQGDSYVYGRARRPCYTCGAPIAYRRSGDGARGTFWCPRCQPAPAD